MKYSDFECIMSAARMSRYRASCRGESKTAMTLYRKNLNLSQELFTIISCFEVAFRNAIDKHFVTQLGQDWLRDAALTGGIFDNKQRLIAKNMIYDKVRGLTNKYSHEKLIAEMGFGFWRYLFSQPQFQAGGQTLLQIFPGKPKSNRNIQYNHTFVFNSLANVVELPNRIAHHEPVCFVLGQPIKNSTYARQNYGLILQLFQWLGIDEAALLYGLDDVNTICNEIDKL